MTPKATFSFPLLFSGMLDDATDTPQTVPTLKTKDQLTVAVAPPVSTATPLPFLMNMTLPTPTATKVGGAPPSGQAPQVVPLQDPPSHLPDPKVDTQPIPLLLNIPPELLAPGPIAPQIPAPAPAPIDAPTHIQPDRPTALLTGGSVWKQTDVKLPNAELAFAARVLAAADTIDHASSDHTSNTADDAPASHESAPLVRTQAPARQQEGAPEQQQQPQRDAKAEPLTSQRSAPPSETRPVPSELKPETLAAPLKQMTAATAPTPVATSVEAAAPAHAPEAPRHVAPTSELHAPDPPAAAPAPPLRDFSLRLTGSDQDKVEVKVVESAGEIRVAVHSADPELTTSLQQGIGELVGKLESRGMRTETWKPDEPTRAAPTTRSETSQNQNQQFSGDGSQGRQQQPQQRQQQTPNPRRSNKPEWLREIDSNLNALPSDIVRRTA